MTPWKTTSRQKVFEHPPFLVLELHSLELPNGKILKEWPWLITPDFVNVLVETEGGQFPCFRQTKYAIEGCSLALVGGFIEPGEEPGTAARRELLEETGYEAEEWIPLGTYVVDANRGAGRAHFFVARHARAVAPPTGEDLEEQQLLLLSRLELERAVDEGQFKALSWAAMAALGLRWLGPRA